VKMRINMKQYPLVEVVWLDAEEKGEIGWNDTKELIRYAKKSCPTMRTVGYLVHEGDEHIALLSTIGPDECSTLEKIPLSFLKSLTYLQPIQKENESDANL